MRPLSYSSGNYRVLLSAVREAGYAFADTENFDPESAERQVFLHHDIDVSPAFAVEMAGIEADLGISSTYLYLPNSPLYNPLSALHRGNIARIAELGHTIGVHVDFPEEGAADPAGKVARIVRTAQEDFPFVKPIFSWHRPNSLTKPLINAKIPGLLNLYDDRFVKSALYMSDSNMRHKAEAFLETARKGEHRKLNFLFHPVYWAAGTESPRALLAFLLDHAIREYAEEVRRFGAWKEAAAGWDATKLSETIQALLP